MILFWFVNVAGIKDCSVSFGRDIQKGNTALNALKPAIQLFFPQQNEQQK
jgi:hypothetical protein